MNETISIEWSEYPWPEWVPQRVREMIANFWGPPNGRKPHEYDRSWKEGSDNHPPMGSIIKCQSDARYWHDPNASQEPRIGRWVPTWNNMSVVVTDEGDGEMRSTCGIIEYLSVPAPHRMAICKCKGAVEYSGKKGTLCRDTAKTPECRFCKQPWDIFLDNTK